MAVQLKSKLERFTRGADITGHEVVMGFKALALPASIGALIYLIVSLLLLGLITDAQERDILWEASASCGLKGLGDGGRNVSIRPVRADGSVGPEITVPSTRADGTTWNSLPTAREACAALSRNTSAWLLVRLLAAFASGFAAGIYAFRRSVRHLLAKGDEVGTDKFLRGARLVPVEHLIELIKSGNKGAGRYTIAGIPIETGMEMRNFASTGSQGVGKSVEIMDMMDQIRAHGRRMVVYDKTGEFTERYFRTGKDVCLNVFDARFPVWRVFDEMTERPHFASVAEALIQESQSGNDRFWIQAARTVFTDICVTLKERGETSAARLYEMAALSRNEELFAFLSGKPGAVFIDPASEKQAQGVRATVSQGVEILRYLPQTGAPFSIREWVLNEDQDSCLFITSRADMHAALMPIFAVFVEIAIIASMGLRPTQNDRLWFILDELASMRKVPSLLTSLTECRKFGVVSIVGFQNEAQLIRIYGKEAAREIMANLQHQSVMRVSDGETARIYSEMLGKQEIDEKSASVSFGAEPVRDGNSIAARRAEIAVVMAAEIQNLPDLFAYFKHAGAYPICKVDLHPLLKKHKARPVVAPDYVRRDDLEVKALPRPPYVIPVPEAAKPDELLPGSRAEPDECVNTPVHKPDDQWLNDSLPNRRPTKARRGLSQIEM